MTKVDHRKYCMVVLSMTMTLLLRGPTKLCVKKYVPVIHLNHITFEFEPVQPSISGKFKQNRRKNSERRRLNRNQKTINGNRSKEMKIVSWNSGHSHLKNQMQEVLWLVEEQKPHIMFISESNLWRTHDIDLVKITGYKLHTTKMMRNPDRQVSCLVAYVKEGITARRRNLSGMGSPEARWGSWQ